MDAENNTHSRSLTTHEIPFRVTRMGVKIRFLPPSCPTIKEPARQSNGDPPPSGQNEMNSQRAGNGTESIGLLPMSSENAKDFQSPRTFAENNVHSQSSNVNEVPFCSLKMGVNTRILPPSAPPTTTGRVGTEVVHHQMFSESEMLDPLEVAGNTKQAEVIETSNGNKEDEVIEESEKPSNRKQIPLIHPDQFIWHYLDPQGQEQGPYSMKLMKNWKERGYFHPEFKVWKDGQSPEEAVLLTDVLQHMFPNLV